MNDQNNKSTKQTIKYADNQIHKTQPASKTHDRWQSNNKVSRNQDSQTKKTTANENHRHNDIIYGA